MTFMSAEIQMHAVQDNIKPKEILDYRVQTQIDTPDHTTATPEDNTPIHRDDSVHHKGD